MEPSYQKETKIESEGNQHVSWRIGGFRRKTGNKYEKVAKIRKNEKIREIKSYHEKKKENCKIHAFAKWGGKHYSKNHQVALE